ncbi:lytic transglycosylase domain-containing protein [Denitratisoma oestradiolicum]|uniref:Lytic transglycosylase n=1 Tax=Denitratisoma oestradiolicum TaxID=311182 RepID=A0A6S6XNG8_9PROT|nr:lytic transglycosylase domain-containing protein [Denitratisoma oestradiolicum]TWO80874.1 lytic transglycosylase [Denitratisoma oestradiolicum]CAB1367366.1 Lytic transglycosylase [Denitratisoma oestradiolicum]
MIRHYTMLLLGALLLLPLAALPREGDEGFLAAREAFRVGDGKRLAQAIENLRGHDLEPWAEYWNLKSRLEDSDDATVAAFLQRESGSYLAERLRGDWLRQLGKKRRWDSFVQAFPPLVQVDQEIQCYAWQALRETTRDPNILDEARALWFNAGELAESCTPLMDQLAVEQRLSADDVWLRIRRLLESGRPRSALAAARYLSDAHMPDLKALEGIAKAPARALKKLPTHFDQTRTGREMALYAVQALGRQDPREAAEQLRPIESRLADSERSYAWGQLAHQAAKRHMAEALGWYSLATDTKLSEEQLAWWVRAALRVQDWTTVRQVIERMPATQADQPDWIYWLGRALAVQGKGETARLQFQRIAGLASFYGNLAAEELGQTITVPPRAAAASSEELAHVSSLPGLRRALALLRLDMRIEGIREWNWTLRGMDDRQLLAAAELARRNDVYDRAIYAAERTLAQHDFELRYLAPFREHVSPQARLLALDDGWVYGLMRQESRFITSARSGVGAKGLMQLMPATAKWVARKIGLTDYHPAKVGETETNVRLGTHYLKMVLDRLDNQPVLACAAYNAGPGRAQRWRADHALEGAIYAETIPFNETRDYVKKVMSNSVYYATMFQDKPQSLKQRLGTIQPRNGNGTGVEELP